jgi:pyridoxamine 5'-phosphate oxidase
VHDDLAAFREEYGIDRFHARDAGTDPMAVFQAWFAHAAQERAVREPNAMTLATVGEAGTPSARMVLLKSVSVEQAAFTWYTNLHSRKAREAQLAGGAALCWWWPGTPSRQVRAVGRVRLVDRATSRTYFDSRPADARIGAAASRQSRAVQDRATIDARAAAIDHPHVELPDDWGGLQLVADELEFWQGRHGRLHDRITFLRVGDDDVPRSTDAITAAGGIDALQHAGSIVTDTHGARWLRTRLEP